MLKKKSLDFLEKESQGSRKIDEIQQRMNIFIDEFNSKQEELRKKVEEEPIALLQHKVNELEQYSSKSWINPAIMFTLITIFLASISMGIAAFNNLTNRVDGVYQHLLLKNTHTEEPR